MAQGKILDLLPTGVAVVTSRKGEKVNGLTLAWMTQVSFNPPLVVVSIAPQRYTHEFIMESKVFVINLLDESQKALAEHFGTSSGRKVDKFKDVRSSTKQTGAPILDAAMAYLECEVVSTYAAGDHSIIVGHVIASKTLKGASPLIFKAKDYF
jgi:flavin reductase (DIM6/NTAB) family NADH-FMN oxidoreductase RutF